MTTSKEIAERFNVDGSQPLVEIPDMDRRDLAMLFGELGFTNGAEIGVERAVYSKMILRRTDGCHLYCVDPWKAYRGYREHVSQEKLDRFYEEATTRLEPYNVTVIRDFSVPASAYVPDGSLDFVYIDGNHELSHVVADLTAWVPKVKAGGIVAGHDYISRKDPAYQMHVVEGVHAYVHAWRIEPLFIVGTKAVEPGQKRDDVRSWFWVKE